jgi:hypothetical protein
MACNWSERTRVASPRRPRFGVGGRGNACPLGDRTLPDRTSEIGRYRALAERATILGLMACNWSETHKVASPRRPRFGVGGRGNACPLGDRTLPDRTLPWNSEIGPYRALAECATKPQAPEAVFGCGYAALGTMQARPGASATAPHAVRQRVFIKPNPNTLSRYRSIILSGRSRMRSRRRV